MHRRIVRRTASTPPVIVNGSVSHRQQWQDGTTSHTRRYGEEEQRSQCCRGPAKLGAYLRNVEIVILVTLVCVGCVQQRTLPDPKNDVAWGDAADVLEVAADIMGSEVLDLADDVPVPGDATDSVELVDAVDEVDQVDPPDLLPETKDLGPDTCEPTCEDAQCGDDDGCGNKCVVDTCDNGNPCDGPETCSDEGECVTGEAVDCDDGKWCNGAETCDDQNGECLPGENPELDDSNECTEDWCDEENDKVEHDPADSLCDDQNPCTTDSCAVEGETPGCHNEAVVDGLELLCTDGNPCTADSCFTGECAHELLALENLISLGCLCGQDGDCDNIEDEDFCNGTLICVADLLGDGDEGVCMVHAETVVHCDDGLWCNGDESCDPGTGSCLGGTPPDLDDGIECTVDECDEDEDQVTHEPDDKLCDDDDPCTTDTCDTTDSEEDEDYCSHEPVECGCQSDADCGLLEDGNLCNGTLYCKKGVEPAVCKVDPGTVKNHDDELWCNGLEGCNPVTGEKVDGQAPELSDGVDCTVDSCDEENDVVKHELLDGACDDSNTCTAETCDMLTGCQFTLLGSAEGDCDDGDPCTINDDCVAGECMADPYDCDDSNPCTNDSCVDEGGQPKCVHDNNVESCDAGPCTVNDVCSVGLCVAGAPIDCTDAHDCTLDTCNPDSGECIHTPDNSKCQDETICDGDETCDEVLGCQEGVALDCDDLIPCTEDSCHQVNGCEHLPVNALCQDETVCDGQEICETGLGCVEGAVLVCDDNTECTTDTCHPADGCVYTPDHAFCDNGIKCIDDVCVSGQGCTQVFTEGACDDLNACTVGDTCSNGQCESGEEILSCDPDHDGLLAELDPCPYAFDPQDLDLDEDGLSDACVPATDLADFAYSRGLALSQNGTPSAWRRTHEPVEIPLTNGILDSSVVGYWPLDGGQALDYSGNGNHGTVVGALAGDGVFGDGEGGMVFDGDDYVDTNHVLQLSEGDSMSVSFWAYLPQVWTEQIGAFGTEVAGAGMQISFGPHASGKPWFYVRDDYGTICYTELEPTAVGTGWHHFAGVLDGQSKMMALLVDGALVDSGTCSLKDVNVAAGRTMYIGASNHSSGTGYFFKGRIDDLLFLDRALSPDEIAAYYESGAPYATRLTAGAQADFDDVRVTEASGIGDPWETGETVKRSRIIGVRPHSDTPCPYGPETALADIPGIESREDLCGVAAYWRLDGDATDVLGEHDGTNNGTTAALGRFGDGGGAMEFAGDDWIEVAAADALSFDAATEAYTAELWFLIGKDPLADQFLLTDRAEPASDIGLRIIWMQDSYKLKFSTYLPDGQQNDEFESEAFIMPGIWHHVAVTNDTLDFRLFIDGLPAGSTPVTFPTTSQKGLVLGATQGADGNFLSGLIDDVLIHNVVKSADYIYHRARPGVPTVRFLANTVVENQGTEESPGYPLRDYRLYWGDANTGTMLPFVSALDDAPEPVPETCYGLQNGCHGYAGWWRFNEGSGQVAVDSSAWKNGAVLMGGPGRASGIEQMALNLSTEAVDYADGGTLPHWSLDESFSLEGVFLPSKAGIGVLRKCADVATCLSNGSPGLVFQLDDTLSMDLLLAGEDSVVNVGGEVTLGQWVAAAMTVDWQVGLTRGFIAHTETAASQKSLAGLGAAANSGSLALGLGDDAVHFEGLFDSVRLSSRALTPDEQLHYPLATWDISVDVPYELACGNTVCPELAGYTASCNPQQHCEYANTDTSGANKWDVWVYVPPGNFMMGSPEGEVGHMEIEGPLHSVTLDYGYFVAKYEVVVEQYAACMATDPGKCTTPSTVDEDDSGWGTNYLEDGTDPADEDNELHARPGHPQNGLTWQQAKGYCGWSAPGGRLLTEAEWEYAATGPVHRLYPWGDAPEPTCANSTAVFNEQTGIGGYGCGGGGTGPVGLKVTGASWSGALDMGGNLWEWVEDSWHGGYSGAPSDGSQWIDLLQTNRVMRGGGFGHTADSLRSARRWITTPSKRKSILGARCVRPLLATECGGMACPVMNGYFTTCNRQSKCEYYSTDTSGASKWDVWVYVPPGSFMMGSDDEGGENDEKPVHEVTFDYGYMIGKYEVVVEQYEACEDVAPGTCTPASCLDWDGNGWWTNLSSKGRGDHPQNGLTMAQAEGFCAWYKSDARLPSEAEWEYAASGPVHRKYPWGDTPPPNCSNGTAVFNAAGGIAGYGCDTGGTWPVGSALAGTAWSGALDMSGNVAEWTLDWYYDSYNDTPTDGSAKVSPPATSHTARGFGFYNPLVTMRLAERTALLHDWRSANLGARCVWVVE
jgi:formylglycine-generating enzyme required for sulfatase activity